MSKIWIIHTGAFGTINESIMVSTKSKKAVGQYIRNNLVDFMFAFRMFGVCDDRGSLGDLVVKIEKDNDLDIHDDDDIPDFVEKLNDELGNYSDTKIVDELYGSSSDSERDYVGIQQISMADVIEI